MPSYSLTIDVKETLRFFDEAPDWSKGHATAIIGVLGEDLAAAALKHCLEKHGAQNVRIRPEPVKNPGLKGPWLDRWIEADLPCGTKVLFQTEIKSWSAQAKGGRKLPVSACVEEVKGLQRRTWDREWDSGKKTLKNHYVAKVLVRMSPPSGTKHVTQLPMIIFWQVVDPTISSDDAKSVDGGSHLFRIRNVTYQFPFDPPDSWNLSSQFGELWVFSVSGYLRFLLKCGCRELELPMPDAAARIQALGRLTQAIDSQPDVT